MSVASRRRERERAAKIENNGNRDRRVQWYDKTEEERRNISASCPPSSSRVGLFDIMPEAALLIGVHALRSFR